MSDPRDEDLRKEVSELRTEVAVLTERVTNMVDAYGSWRTAMYSVAGAVLIAAFIIVLVGRPS